MNRRLKKEELIYGMFDEPDDIPDYNKGRPTLLQVSRNQLGYAG